MSKSLSEPLLRRCAWAWLALVLALLAHGAWLLASHRLQVETDVLAMLPQDPAHGTALRVTRALADAAERRVIVLVGAPDAAGAARAGDAAAALLDGDGLALRYRVGSDAAAALLDFYTPYRAGLLDAAQRERLQRTPPDELTGEALAQLYQPMSLPRVGSFAADPLNLFGQWLTDHGRASRVRVVDGRLMLDDGAQAHAVLMLTLADSAFSLRAGEALEARLAAARTAALQAVPRAELLAIGVPRFATAAAEQAQREVHVIGAGSLIGIVLLTWCAFGGLRPRVLVAVSIAVGLLAAVCATSALFAKLHLITLVFGASLVGVAENYGSNYFANRAGRPLAERFAMLGEQWGTLWLALATTVIGYALLALTPFPGLRQIAVFSVVGLVAAFVTTLLWFPFLDGGSLRLTRFAAWLGGLRARWPAPLPIGILAPLLVIAAVGLAVLRADDDIRALQNAPANLVKQQQQIGRLMDLPNPSRFFLVQGADAEQLLEREEALVAVLHERGMAAQAVSDWLPSLQRQRADAALRARVDAQVLAEVARRTGSAIQPAASAEPVPLRLEAWLASPVSEVARHLWLGAFDGGVAGVVMLEGAPGPRLIAGLATLRLPGVRWIDKVADISDVMRRTRVQMTMVLILSAVFVLGALLWRFGLRGWRALAPTLLASVLAVGLPALFGVPLQLFNVLALLLILGMGVDYGIFMLSQPDRAAVRPFLSVTLAAVSTLLAFGLLALSATPGLRAFGLTMLLGLAAAWALTPFFVGNEPNET